jgi:hypothetical protein
MKQLKLLFILLAVFALGFGLGRAVGLRRALHRIGDEMVADQLRDAQHAAECEARGYLFSLQALDSGRAEDITALRERALTHLSVFVQGVHDLRGEGYDWTPVNGQFFTNATLYLAGHQKKQ